MSGCPALRVASGTERTCSASRSIAHESACPRGGALRLVGARVAACVHRIAAGVPWHAAATDGQQHQRSRRLRVVVAAAACCSDWDGAGRGASAGRSASVSGSSADSSSGCEELAASAPSAPSAPQPSQQLGWGHSFAAKYTLAKVLGKGSFGVVWEAVHHATGMRYAVKVLQKQRRGRCHLQAIRQEVDLWAKAQASHFVAQLVGLYEDDEHAYIVQELCTGGDLRSLVEQHDRLPEAMVASVMRGVLDMLVECHRHTLVYGDVKPANFLLQAVGGSADGLLQPALRRSASVQALPAVRAVDFGCAHHAGKAAAQGPRQCGTPLYSAPEMALLKRPSMAVDVWAAGVMMYQLLTGRLPFWQNKGLSDVAHLPPYEVLAAVRTHEISYPHETWAGLSPQGRELVESMLARNPGERISAERALSHPWFADMLGYAPLPTSAGHAAASVPASPTSNVVDFVSTNPLRRSSSTLVLAAAYSARQRDAEGTGGGLPAAAAASPAQLEASLPRGGADGGSIDVTVLAPVRLQSGLGSPAMPQAAHGAAAPTSAVELAA